MLPTSAGPAPSVAANRGMTGMRRYELKKAAKPIRQIRRKGARVCGFLVMRISV